MTIKELIAALQKCPSDATVFMKKKHLRENAQGYFIPTEGWIPVEKEDITIEKNNDMVYLGEL